MTKYLEAHEGLTEWQNVMGSFVVIIKAKFIRICIYLIRPVQPGPGAHPAYCKMGTGSSPGLEAAGA